MCSRPQFTDLTYMGGTGSSGPMAIIFGSVIRICAKILTSILSVTPFATYKNDKLKKIYFHPLEKVCIASMLTNDSIWDDFKCSQQNITNISLYFVRCSIEPLPLMLGTTIF